MQLPSAVQRHELDIKSFKRNLSTHFQLKSKKKYFHVNEIF